MHALALLGDGYLKPSLLDVTLPGFIAYETFWTSLGIVGGWMFVILGLSYYVRGRIGPQRWRKLHRFTALAWVLGIVHALGAGTDAGAPWFLLAAAMVVLPARRAARQAPAPGGDDMRFDCFGTTCGVWGDGAADAHRQLEALAHPVHPLRAHSELSRLNADPRGDGPVSPDDGAAAEGDRARGGRDRRPGRRDARAEIEAAGYTATSSAACRSTSRWRSLRRAHPPAARPTGGFTLLRAGDLHLVRRPPGLKFDSGGLAKGLFADLIAERMRGDFAVDCGGDLRFGGRDAPARGHRPVRRPAAARLRGHRRRRRHQRHRQAQLARRQGRPAHHLLDPSTGRPAFTGVVQATALAPTALEAEWRAKAAVLSADPAWLKPYGGVLVHDDGSHQVLNPGEHQ